MKKIILLMLLLTISTVGAIEYSYVFTKNQDIDLHISCFDINNSHCLSTTTCQLTTYYPNQTILLSNVSMGYNQTFFNYTIPGSLINVGGEYTNIATCQGSENGFSTFIFLVTPTGIRPSDQKTNATTRSVYFVFGIGIILFLIFAFAKLKPPVKWTFFIFGIMFWLISINILSVGLSDEVVNPKLESLFDSLTAISFIFLWFAGGLLIIMWVFTFLNSWFYKKNLRNAQRFGGEYG